MTYARIVVFPIIAVHQVGTERWTSGGVCINGDSLTPLRGVTVGFVKPLSENKLLDMGRGWCLVSG